MTRIKRGLIYPRNSMVSPYTAQGLPQIYGEVAPYMVQLYDFGEATGLYAYDKSASKATATLVAGASGNSIAQMWSNGLPGSVDCDGTNDYINIGKTCQSYVDYNKASTLECWVNFDTLTSSSSFNFTTIQANFPSSKYNIFSFRLAKNYIDYIYYQYIGTNNLRYYIREGSITSYVSAGNWYHFVATHSGNSSATGMKIYINGAIRTTSIVYNDTITGTIWYASGIAALDQFLMGRNNAGSLDEPIDGKIAKYALYNTELSADQILRLYNIEKQYLR